jgi:hypothetical protein
MRRQLMMAGFMKLEKVLLRFDDAFVDVNNRIVGIIETKKFADGRL